MSTTHSWLLNEIIHPPYLVLHLSSSGFPVCPVSFLWELRWDSSLSHHSVTFSAVKKKMHSNFQSFNPAAVGHKHMTCSITPGTLCAVLYTYLQLFTFLCANFRQFLWCCRDVRQGISTVNGHSDKLSKLMLSKLLHHKCFCTQWKT